jgi:hypothetical protein
MEKFAMNHFIESGAVPFACASLNVVDLSKIAIESLADVSDHGCRVTVRGISA